MNHTLMPMSEFKARRALFAKQLPDNSVTLLFAGQEVTRSNDTEYLFCQDKSFYYLTGFTEPDAVLMIEKMNGNVTTTLFCLAKDPFAEVWHGKRIGCEKAKDQYAFDAAYSLDEIDCVVEEAIANKQSLCFFQGHNPHHDDQVYTWLDQVKGKVRQGISAPNMLINCHPIVDELRLIKTDAELEVMRKVNEISGRAHQRAMEKTQVGMFEYQIEAELLHEFARHGAREAAYNSIVAGGNNANILHYTNNSDVLTNGDLLLIDAGGELAGYAADITRTFPVNGKFTPEQKALYQLVLDAQIAAINAIKPGADFGQLNDICQQILTEGLLNLGILEGDITQLITDKACKQYFIHGLGHWLGLDVHDVGDYHMKDKRQTRAFQPGMVMTIEPGLYIPADDENVEAKWRGIGIRIEDNIVVTDQGHENLTEHVPKFVDDIERIMQDAKR
ncbi:Xaa-Pro aminopeptidase [Thalassotalea hakodatensis]|uniref:Xaa-Pro aminopeptidase n=1 Tax=Thalassotalea hakodatensis TaxID=3030492 RepID=UPI002573B12C|nr:Xaa-Pro aminopeptidase [Thalassotalea hakodatensis]